MAADGKPGAPLMPAGADDPAAGAPRPRPIDLRQFSLFLIAGEHSGDALGGKLMAAINRRLKGRVRYLGVGGEAMEKEGLVSQFPLAEVAVMGPLSILSRLPRLVRRVYSTAGAAVAAEPDAVVIIDSPEFTHPIARRIRARRPDIPIIDYVSPSVWAWRPGRAAHMRRYVDHVLALLPFEPEAHERLGGPECTYVGHPLIERHAWLQSIDPKPLAQWLRLHPQRPVVVMLPGSRPSEVGRLLQPFAETIELLRERRYDPQVIVPTVDAVRPQIVAAMASWSFKPHLVSSEEDKFRAFKLARAALAASGTVTLELGLAGTPAVVAYRVDAIAARLRFLLKVPSVVLTNLVLGENVYPEFIQEEASPEAMVQALEPLLLDTEPRARQLEGLARLPARMLRDGTPSEAAADVVLRYAEHGRFTTNG